MMMMMWMLLLLTFLPLTRCLMSNFKIFFHSFSNFFFFCAEISSLQYLTIIMFTVHHLLLFFHFYENALIFPLQSTVGYKNLFQFLQNSLYIEFLKFSLPLFFKHLPFLTFSHNWVNSNFPLCLIAGCLVRVIKILIK